MIVAVQHAVGQHYDSLAIQCIERQDIFGLRDVYVKHKHETQKQGTLDTLRIGGLGGWSRVDIYS